MKITVFTSNQPRHLSLVRSLEGIASEIFFICEVNTVFPGQIDDFFKKSDIMQDYFLHMTQSERRIFGDVSFSGPKTQLLPIKNGDLNRLDRVHLKQALNSDLYIIFGGSYIKGWLLDHLVSHGALNIHMGISPYYRGTACNFWAMYDNKPGFVGATIHKLSGGLDSGNILYHAVPAVKKDDNIFDFTMRSVEAAHECLIEKVKTGEIFNISSFQQDRSLEIRYSRNSEFNGEVAYEFLQRDLSKIDNKITYPKLIRPFFQHAKEC